MNISLLFNNFTGGEISPLLWARADSPSMAMAAKRLENFVPIITGGVRKRPGTWYDGRAKGNQAARLVDWLLPDGSCLVLEITPGVIRFWGEEGLLPQEIATAYTAAQIWGIKYAASGNVLWLVHRDAAPAYLSWSGGVITKTLPSFTGKDFASPGNYPGAVAFDAGRLCLAGTRSEPNRLYLSRPPDSATGQGRYTDFTLGPGPADAIAIEENDMQGSRLLWLAASRRLLAATERATWSDTGEVPTPSSFDMNIVQYSGAADLQGAGMKEMLVYSGRSGKSLRALVWRSEYEKGEFADADISRAASHLFSSGIRDIAVTDDPYPVVWIATGDGGLVSCTVDLSAGVVAYARHPTDGAVDSVAVAPRAGGDALYIAVRRGGDSNIEHLAFENLDSFDFSESHYVDSGARVALPSPAKVITGLSWLAGKTVSVFADGAAEPPAKVGGDGSLALGRAVSVAHIGLPYRSAFSPSTQPLPSNGASLAKKRRLENARLVVYKSLGGECGAAGGKAEALPYMRYGGYALGSAPEPFSGTLEVTVSGNIDTEAGLEVSHGEPVPFTLLALVERVAILEA
jgi:hypothetical protein